MEKIFEQVRAFVGTHSNITINKLFVNLGDVSYRNAISYNQLIEQLGGVNYTAWYTSIGGKGAKSDRVERGPFEPFVVVFYTLFCILRRLPTPQEVCECYRWIYCTDMGNGISRLASGFTFRTNDLYGRITRAYCSWCREMTLLYALFEILPRGFVPYYDLRKDMHGVDIVIIHNGHTYNVHSYLNSAKSHQYRTEKDIRYEVEAGIHIDVVADRYNTRRIGDINVHGLANAADLMRMMYEHENTVG